MSQQTSWPIFMGVLTELSVRAVDFIVARSREPAGLPVTFVRIPLERQEFCDNVRKLVRGFHVSTLSDYRRCWPETRALAALDFPFAARNWSDAPRLFNGPAGMAVAEALPPLGLRLVSFWRGETRVLSSSKVIASAQDLKGRTVITPPTFASTTLVTQGGGKPVAVPGGDMVAALQRGVADTADVSLSFYSRNLIDTQKAVLLSNHVFDPVVVVAPVMAVETLSPVQRGFVESLMRQATAFQRAQAQADETRQLATFKERGVQLLSLTDASVAAFKTPAFARAMQANVGSVFANSSAAVRSAGGSQVQGAPIAAYWKVFFATNRSAVQQQFTKQMAPSMSYGLAQVEFEFDESLSFPDEVIKGLIRYATKGKGVVIDWPHVSSTGMPPGLSRAAPAVPSKAPLVYVHGFANSFDEALRRAAWIGWNAKRPVITYSWPSQGSATPGDYKTDRRTADQSVAALTLLLERVGRDYDSATDVDILIHSMGGRVLLGALEALQRKSYPEKPPRFRQLIMVAPDVPTSRLRDHWGPLRPFFQKNATLYVSDHDMALGISRGLMNPEEGGRAGLAPPVWVQSGIESVFIGRNDFSFTGHSYHVANGVIADDLMEALRYGTGAGDRRGIGPSPGGGGYFELRRLKNP